MATLELMFVDTQEEVLNDQQRAAVAHDGGNLLIVAGAGTGQIRAAKAKQAGGQLLPVFGREAMFRLAVRLVVGPQRVFARG